jgi:hypothetical protein
MEANLTDPEREFLLAAADRHTVFDYANIAEYYAHAPADIQELMEHSALIIIDYEQSIELGYTKMTDQVAALAEIDKENGEIDDEEK